MAGGSSGSGGDDVDGEYIDKTMPQLNLTKDGFGIKIALHVSYLLLLTTNT